MSDRFMAGFARALVFSSAVSLLDLSLPDAPSLAAQVPSPPVVNALFTIPSRTADWNRYSWVAACGNAVQRTLDSLTFAIPQDTVDVNLFASFPPEAARVTDDCVRHVSVATVPAPQLTEILNLAAARGDDSLVRAVVARQLLLVPAASVQQKAAVLDTAVTALMRAYRTPEKTQLAKALTAQGDALGPAALIERAKMHYTVDAPLPEHVDIDGELAFRKEMLGLEQQIAEAPDGLIPPQDKRAWKIAPSVELAGEKYWTWLKTGAEPDFQQYVAEFQRAFPNHPLVGAAAPQVHGSYWFLSPSSNVPQRDSMTAVPILGKVNMIVFVDPVTPLQNTGPLTWLQHMQQKFPELQITLISYITGAIHNKYLVDHPDQEAVLLHRYFTDSLALPGYLCVDSSTFQQLPTGEMHRLLSSNEERYGSEKFFLIDPRGRVVSDEGLGGDEARMSYVIRLLQRLSPH